MLAMNENAKKLGHREPACLLITANGTNNNKEREKTNNNRIKNKIITKKCTKKNTHAHRYEFVRRSVPL